MSVSPAFCRAVGGDISVGAECERWGVAASRGVADVDRGGLPVRAAAQLLGRSERQVWRLLKAFRSDGAAGLISKKRGRPSNRKTASAVVKEKPAIAPSHTTSPGPSARGKSTGGRRWRRNQRERPRSPMMARLLIVDDNAPLGELLRAALSEDFLDPTT